MEKYYLVARNKDKGEEDFKLLALKETWYLGKQGREEAKKALSLEAIDLVTMKFHSKEELVERLYKNHYISTPNVDLFIAKRNQRKGRKYIRFYELIYNPNQKDRIHDLQEIAMSFLAGKKEEQQEKIDLIFNKCIHKASYHEGYRNILTTGMTNVPKRLTDSFWTGTENYALKYQNQALLQSYPAIRNIVESLNRADLLEERAGDFTQNNIHYLNENGAGRASIQKHLLQVLDPDYMEGQLELFSTEMLSSTSEKKIHSNEKEILDDSLPSLSEEEEQALVLDTFSNIPFGVMEYRNQKTIFHAEKEEHMATLSEEEKIQLESLLPEKLALYLSLYLVHKKEYEQALMYFANTDLLEQEMRRDYTTIVKLLQKKETRKRAYQWCQIYLKYQNMDIKGDDGSGMGR